MDLTKVKYYPDKFYIQLDNFDLNNLTSFLFGINIDEDASLFIHEYYHYITNITTFSGLRQFHLNFCDRFRVITRLSNLGGIYAFPIRSKSAFYSRELYNEWMYINEIIDSMDLDYDFIKEVELSQNKTFSINSISNVTSTVGGISMSQVVVDVSGLVNRNEFVLTFGVIDEFLSTSIDEYLFETDLSSINYKIINNRPTYPYHLFEKIISFYQIKFTSGLDKILIAYFALQSSDPPGMLIEILESLQDPILFSFYTIDPEYFLLRTFDVSTQYLEVLNALLGFAEECESQGRVHIAQSIKYYYDKYLAAFAFTRIDFYHFIRPFMGARSGNIHKDSQRVLMKLGRIVNQFTPPVILTDNSFKTTDKLTSFGESTLTIIALHEIMSELEIKRIAYRSESKKQKYLFPGEDPDGDKINWLFRLPVRIPYQIALNEISLLGMYISYLKKGRKRAFDVIVGLAYNTANKILLKMEHRKSSFTNKSLLRKKIR